MTSTRSRSSSTYSSAEGGVAGFRAAPAFTGPRALQLADLSERALEVRAGLDVHGQHVGARARTKSAR